MSVSKRLDLSYKGFLNAELSKNKTGGLFQATSNAGNIVFPLLNANFGVYGEKGYSKIKDEFLNKRMHLYNLLWSNNFKAPKKLFQQTEYDYEFDQFLYKDVGYAKLSNIVNGLFVSPYSPTSLREYFATGFTEFYLESNLQVAARLGWEREWC